MMEFHLRLGRVRLLVELTREPLAATTPAGPLTIDAPIAGTWIPAAGLRAGARVAPGQFVGTIDGEPIESKIGGRVLEILADQARPGVVGDPLLLLAREPT